jgi:hypothetical protein
MRLLSLVLLVLLSSGCGSDRPANRNLGPHIGLGVSPPAITQLTPNTAPVNSAPFTMTVDGVNFNSDAIVFWNGIPQQTMIVTDTQLLVAVTADDLTFGGLDHVFVSTGGMNSNTVDFNVTPQ